MRMQIRHSAHLDASPASGGATLGGGRERELDIGRSPPNGAIAYVALQSRRLGRSGERWPSIAIALA